MREQPPRGSIPQGRRDAGGGAGGPNFNRLLIAVVIAYICGWRLMFGEFLLSAEPLAIGHGVAVRINDAFYGLWFSSRFFDAPFISWIGMLAAIVIASGGSQKVRRASPD